MRLEEVSASDVPLRKVFVRDDIDAMIARAWFLGSTPAGFRARERAVALSEGHNATPCPLTSLILVESHRAQLEQLIKVGLLPAPMAHRDFGDGGLISGVGDGRVEELAAETSVANFAKGVAFNENLMLVAATLPESIAFGSIIATSKNELVQRHELATKSFGFEDTAFRGRVEFTQWNYTQPRDQRYSSQYYRSGNDDRCCDDCMLLCCYLNCCTDFSSAPGRHDYFYVDGASGNIAWYAPPDTGPCCAQGVPCNLLPCGASYLTDENLYLPQGLNFEMLGGDASWGTLSGNSPCAACCNGCDLIGLCSQNELQLDKCFGDCGDCFSSCFHSQLMCLGGASLTLFERLSSRVVRGAPPP